MQTLEQRIAELKAKKEEMESQEDFDLNEYNKIVNDLSEAEYELAQQQEKQQRDQKQQEVIESTVDVLPEAFEAFLPASTFEEIFGLTEYGDKRKQFYQLIEALTADRVQKATEPYEQDLALKDQKIFLMNKQSLEVQQQMDVIFTHNQELAYAFESEKDAHDKTQAELASVRGQLNTALSDSAVKDEKIAELQTKLEALQQPKSAPSADVKRLITDIKSQNTMSVDDMIARFNARQKVEHKIPLPPLEVPTAPATFPQAEPADDTVRDGAADASDTTVPAEVTPPAVSFPQPTDDAGTQVANEQQGVQHEGADVAKEIEHIKARLDRLEKQANLPELVA